MSLCWAGGCTALAALSTPGVAGAATPAGIDAPRVVGDWYLERFPEERTETRLIGLLSKSIPGFSGRGDIGDNPAFRDAVRGACATDFERRDVVSIGGWLLARTEARLCALVSSS